MTLLPFSTKQSCPKCGRCFHDSLYRKAWFSSQEWLEYQCWKCLHTYRTETAAHKPTQNVPTGGAGKVTVVYPDRTEVFSPFDVVSKPSKANGK